MQFRKSLQHYHRAMGVVPMGTSTFSKNPNLYTLGAAPLYIDRAEGCRIFDLDGNSFVDYSMALCIVLLGYSNPEVNAAAKKAIDDGLIFTLSCPEEVRLAERIMALVPGAEMVRFSKSGSDSCEGAVRLARSYTGKLKVMTVGGYHGFHDWYIASTPRNKGIPLQMSDWVLPHDYNDIATIEETINAQADDIAALIMEPVINYEPENGFLEKIRALTRENNIVLIFDEMKTGFRLALGGGQQFFNVIPDLAVFGKALANGFPLSALGGKKALMQQFEDENCFFSASYATEKASLAAALKTLEILEKRDVIAHIWDMGQQLINGARNLVVQHRVEAFMQIVGLAPMSHVIITPVQGFTVNEIKSFIQQECAKRGQLFAGYHHPSFAHGKEDIRKTLDVYDEVFGALKQVIEDGSLVDKLKGKAISSFGVRR